MTQRGFTMLELLVAAALVLVLAAALTGLTYGMQRAFDASVSSVDLTARARAGLSVLTADLQAAGGGVIIGQALQGLPDVMPVIVPQRSLADGSIAAPLTALSIVRATGAQGMLRDVVVAGSVVLQLDPSAPSVRQNGTAGFVRGDTAVVMDATRVERVTINAVDAVAWTITLSAPLRYTFEPGAVIASIERTTYGLRSDASGTTRLVRRTAGGAEQPVVDHVTTFDLSLFGVAEPPTPPLIPSWFPSYGPAAPPLGVDDARDTYPPGENCTLAVDGSGHRLARLAHLAPSGMLVPLTAMVLSDGPWCPDPGDPEAFDADLLRVRRVDLRLGFEAPQSVSRRVAPLSITMSTAVRQW